MLVTSWHFGEMPNSASQIESPPSEPASTVAQRQLFWLWRLLVVLQIAAAAAEAD